MALRPTLKTIPLVKDDRFALLRVRGADLAVLKRHVFKRYPVHEWGTFFRCGFRRTSWGLALSYVDPILPLPGDLDRQSGMTVFRDQYTRRAFQQASNPAGLAVGVVHSHPESYRTSPSPLDDDMDDYFSRELVAFSGGSPYCSFILQESDTTGLTVSGRVYDRGEWFPLRWLLEIGDTLGRTLSELVTVFDSCDSSGMNEESTSARLESLFGERAAARIRASKVGIIGCSGTGSPAAEVLCRAGVGEFILVDPQRFARSNLERLHGSVHADAANPKALPYKVDILRRMLTEINPAVRITSFVGNILHANVLDDLLRCDVLIGSTDTFHGRAVLSDLASHYLLPSVDVGVLMDGANGKVTTQLVELNRYHPDLPCAFCSGVVDPGALAEELMTEAEREARKLAAIEAVNRGDAADQYWKGRPRQLNTVGYLTTTAGALAAGYAEGWITGAFKLPHDRFQFDIGQTRMSVVAPTRQRDAKCSCSKHLGWADQANSFRSVVLPPHWSKRAILTAKA
jgi:hypothetical protein